jgi:hypothetical protein
MYKAVSCHVWLVLKRTAAEIVSGPCIASHRNRHTVAGTYSTFLHALRVLRNIFQNIYAARALPLNLLIFLQSTVGMQITFIID